MSATSDLNLSDEEVLYKTDSSTNLAKILGNEIFLISLDNIGDQNNNTIEKAEEIVGLYSSDLDNRPIECKVETNDNQSLVASFLDRLPEDVLIEQIFPMLMPYGYPVLHLVCKRFRRLLLQWSHLLPKMVPRACALRFTKRTGCTKGCNPRNKCRNILGHSSNDEPSLAVLLRHFNLSEWGVVFGLGYVVSDALLKYLVDEQLVSFGFIFFEDCNMVQVTEKGMKKFLQAVAEAGACENVLIELPTRLPVVPTRRPLRNWLPKREDRRVALNRRADQAVFTDESLQPIFSCLALGRFIIQQTDQTHKLTNQTLVTVALNIPNVLVLNLSKSTNITAQGLCDFIQAFRVYRVPKRMYAELVVSQRLKKELNRLLPPDEDVPHCDSFYYERPIVIPYEVQRLIVFFHERATFLLSF